MKKLPGSDWLRAVQFKCNTSAKSVTPVQITHCNSGLWLVKDNRKCSKQMISRKMATNILCGNFEKRFLEWEKNAFKKDLPSLPPREFFHVYIINK